MYQLTIVLALMGSHTLLAQAIPDKATDVSPLLIGEKVPKALLSDVTGRRDSLSNISCYLEPTVLIFYRGGWCPDCNTHFSRTSSYRKRHF
ncbi:MAG: hypothetical protein U5K54_05045 [Cytophagales bacterium]|nr:hypothetical protein [Cytophagales bacterium]